MEFGLDKCKKLNIKNGKIVGGSYTFDDQEISAMEDEEFYKYLGYNQARILEHKTIKEKLKLEYTRRINSVCKMQLSSKNLFKALNTHAIPVLTYSFGVVRWSNTDINA